MTFNDLIAEAMKRLVQDDLIRHHGAEYVYGKSLIEAISDKPPVRPVLATPEWLDGLCDHLAREMDKSKAP